MNTFSIVPESAGSSPKHSRKIMKACQKRTFLGSFSSGLHHLAQSSDVCNQEVTLNALSGR